MTRRASVARLGMGVLLSGWLFACAPTLQRANRPDTGFLGPGLEAGAFRSFDGARLGLTQWEAANAKPWAVIVGVHGMNDYANTFHLAAPWWAARGVTTYAYDQRGFGRSPQRGIWAPDALRAEDLRTLVALVRRRHPGAIVAVVGESLGAAVAVEAFASEQPPDADRLVLAAPAVWGWSDQPLGYRALLWLAAHLVPAKVFKPPAWLTARVSPTDNRSELMAMGVDPLMIWGARSDALYGLVTTMQKARNGVGRLQAPTLFLYGAHDQIIPKSSALRAARRLPTDDRSVLYPDGWHLLLRDRQGPVVWEDILTFVRDPTAPLPSRAPGLLDSPLQRRGHAHPLSAAPAQP